MTVYEKLHLMSKCQWLRMWEMKSALPLPVSVYVMLQYFSFIWNLLWAMTYATSVLIRFLFQCSPREGLQTSLHTAQFSPLDWLSWSVVMSPLSPPPESGHLLVEEPPFWDRGEGPSLKILPDYPESRWRFRDRHRILFLIENVLFSLSLCIMSTQTLFFLNKEVLIIY